jgi:L-alanine-DL-glutamate epimerase-like enolase superfamily enzyme
MRVVSLAARTVRWPIASQGAARGCSERAAVILEARSERGAIGLGEAAPLPGMSLDTLDDVARAIAAFARLAPFEVLARDPSRIGDRALSPGGGPPGPAGTADRADAFEPCMPFAITDREVAHAFAMSPPAARFAIETALLDALAREHGISVAALLDALVEHVHSRPDLEAASPMTIGDAHVGAGHAVRRPPSPDPDNAASPIAVDDPESVDRVVPLAAVVDDPRAARQAFAAGIRCLKIKLVAADDPGRVVAIAAAAPEARLRIDANRTWPRAEVVDRLAALAQLPIDYVEEPCVDAHMLLAESLPCRIALDEGLLQMTSDEIHAALRSPQLAAIVLKPTLLGGFSVVLPLAALARRSGVAAIVSHTLEGPIGTAACAELALALGHRAPRAAHAALASGHPASLPANAAPGSVRRAALAANPAPGDTHPADLPATPAPGGAHPVGLAAHAALAGWRIEVPQLAADHVHSAAAPGLGFVDLDLDGVVRA